MVGDPLLARRIKVFLPLLVILSRRIAGLHPQHLLRPHVRPGRRRDVEPLVPAESHRHHVHHQKIRLAAVPPVVAFGVVNLRSRLPFIAAHVHRATVADRAERQRPVQ